MLSSSVACVVQELDVVDVLDGTPARRAGLCPLDRIIAIDGKPVAKPNDDDDLTWLHTHLKGRDRITLAVVRERP